MKGIIFLWVFSTFLLNVLKAQTVDLRFHEFHSNNDLSSIYLSSIEQDDLGFMWFGTNNGLNRFDGYEYKKYLSDEGMDFGIAESNINKLYSDSKGWLWISLNSNVCYYDSEADSIVVVANESTPRGLSDYYITCFNENSDSVLYVSTVQSIYRFNRKTGSFIEVFKIQNGTISNFIFIGDEVYVSCLDGGGVYTFNLETKEFKQFAIPEKYSDVNSITDIEFYNDKLWLSTQGGGVFSCDLSTFEFKNYPGDSEYSLNVLELYIDKDNYLWKVDFTGLKLYVKDRDFFQGYYPEDNNEYSIKPYIKNVFQDKHHNFWTIHSPGGIGFSPRPKGIQRFDSNINSPFRLTNNNLSTVCEDAEGNLWMGNPFNGIDVFNWSKGRTETYYHENSNPNSLGKGATQYIFRDSKLRMWIGTYWGGIQLYRPETNDFISFVHDPASSNSLSCNDIRSIAEDQNGYLWLCTHSTGVDKFDVINNTFLNFNFEKNNLANDYTFDVICDSLNRMWVATAWGLSFLEQGATQFKNYFYSASDETSLCSNVVNTIYIDKQGRVWIGTDKGLNLYQPDTDNFKRFCDGFANKNIVSIESDQEHKLWLGTYSGISCLDPETGTVINLNKDDGLISNVFNNRSVYNNGKGTLFFGSVDGINYFNPGEFNFNNTPPEVYLTKLKVYNEAKNVHNSELLSRNIVVSDQIEFDHSQKIIEFEFAALNYVGSERNSYAYYLEGFENDWNYVGNRRNVSYTNLDPGNYLFRLKAANNEGFWNEEGLSLKIIIKPPFWNTIWFKILVVMVLFLLIVIVINLREKNLRKSNLILESKVKERTNEIYKQNIALKTQKRELEKANKLKNRFFSILGHDLRGPVNSILQLNKMLQSKIISKNDEKINKILELSISTALNTSDLLEDLLLWGKTQTKDARYVFEKNNLHDLVHESVLMVKQIAMGKEISIENLVDSSLDVVVDANALKVIVRNLLSNAIKFSERGNKVNVYSQMNADKVIVIVEDSGVGMSKEFSSQLFSSDINTSNPGTIGEKGSGLGLILCEELVHVHRGQIWLESDINEGSKFYFSLALNLNETVR